MQIENKVFLITGAGSGLGAAVARMAVGAGARVALLDVNAAAGQALADELGAAALFIRADVTSASEGAAAVAATLQKFGQIDVAVNCAGILGPCKTLSRGEVFPMDLWNRVIAINLTGTFNVVRYASLAMSKNEPNADGERGVIINTSSGAAWQGQMGQAAYSASKAAVIGMTLPVARDLAQHGIRVVAVAPGLFETAMSSGMPTKVSQNIIDNVILFPHRMGQAPEFGGLVRHIVENAYLNATTISLDAGAR